MLHSRNIETDAKAIATPAVMLKDEDRQRCEVWTRVMGYHRPTSSFNLGKKSEFKERVYFTERRTNVD
ncbi:hypothetical protein J2T09_002012 [Neorhizobium huautlense]|uniref:Uncharacterized protein n=1 Tax=Neorhizobium huautlense TaxID=67774 RepID=A0ABT9PSS7_9HYPH|nr:anaerobic ribonucleoside-triphosphate reductase [Neorhizobium huautlense]MDP9837260.1 hypothetical protein [Neorhizobium huautlense]